MKTTPMMIAEGLTYTMQRVGEDGKARVLWQGLTKMYVRLEDDVPPPMAQPLMRVQMSGAGGLEVVNLQEKTPAPTPDQGNAGTDSADA